ncbi:hypothetical protein [Tahibacter amnicola]|uniref:Uncharacterized protein n=1 Tax=Tahibacter amnicola TaxID=2976241 RepID=A0ABY6BPK3_9GAMM|nr:hypothetical protein [Tahibacter amnicola]UXI70481.1 hypothetical protein N4264_12840 [Tahibacter amnicola]
MARIAIETAPPASVPLRFLASAPAWGMVAGALLVFAPDAALASRWHPATLAITHAVTLGVLGNAMFGSLLQFLPAAAGVRLCGGRWMAAGVHVLLNSGAVLLVWGLQEFSAARLQWGALALMAAFAGLASMTLPGLLGARAARLLRTGLALSVVGGVTTALLGCALVSIVTGWLSWPLVETLDLHVTWGIAVWIGVLLVTVGRVVLPMFLGVAAYSDCRQRVVLGSLVGAAVLVTVGTALAYGQWPLRQFIGALGACIAASACVWVVATARGRNPGLRAYWLAGLVGILAAGLMASVAGDDGMAAGTLLVVWALPTIVVGTLLEIATFVTWIVLQRSSARGTPLPTLQRLLPERQKFLGLGLQCASGVLLLLAVLQPTPAHLDAAGWSLLGSYACFAGMLLGLHRQAGAFVRLQGRHA